MRATPLLAACLLGEASLIYAVLINITVDDWLPNRNTSESLTYTSAWKIGQDCAGCAARPDPKIAYRGSWHDTTYNETSLDHNQRDVAFLTFNGSALYVYGIQGHTNGNPTGNTDLSFFIDEQLYQNNSYGSRGVAGYTYDVLLFAVDSLPLQTHTFKLQNGRHGGGISTVLLDYFIYTTDYSPPLNATNQPNAPLPSSSSPRSSELPHELTPPNTPEPSPSESAPSTKPGAPLSKVVEFAAAICIGITLGAILIWRGAVFYYKRKSAVHKVKRHDVVSVVSTDTLSSQSQTLQVSENHTQTIDAISNTCVVQTEVDNEPPHPPVRFPSLARRTEKWHTFFYGGNRSSR